MASTGTMQEIVNSDWLNFAALTHRFGALTLQLRP
jgi:hypothetical protein